METSIFVSNMKMKKAIIWDWNGTLLNDVDVCIFCMNKLLTDRGLKPLDKTHYRDIFEFPVKEYYKKAGFNFEIEPFEIPAMQFIDLYYKHVGQSMLFPGTMQVLTTFYQKRIYQTILSAMEHESLLQQMKTNAVEPFFENVSGINDHYAHSKLEIGKELLEKIPYPKNEILLVGDTLHDMEVAEELNVNYVLISKGHQSREKLQTRSRFVIDSFGQIGKFYKT